MRNEAAKKQLVKITLISMKAMDPFQCFTEIQVSRNPKDKNELPGEHYTYKCTFKNCETVNCESTLNIRRVQEDQHGNTVCT